MAQKITLAQRVRDLWLAGFTVTELTMIPDFVNLTPADVQALVHAYQVADNEYRFISAVHGIVVPHELDIRA